MPENKSVILAVAGKGGVGKTSIAAAMTRIICQTMPDARVLAVDADPAIGLATALGVTVTSTLDDIRKSVVASAESGRAKEAIELLNEARYRIFDTMVEGTQFSFLAIGRPEAAGCYCTVNAYLKEVIGMLADEFDYVIIDGEAGIEQINRRVMERVTHLVLVSDQSKKGLSVIQTIKRVADELTMYDQLAVIINRAIDPALTPGLDLGGLNVSACIPADETHARNEIQGQSIFDLPEDSPLIQGVRQALNSLGVLWD